MCDAQAAPSHIQYGYASATAWTVAPDHLHHSPVRVLSHIKKLDDCFGQFLVRVVCLCGSVREIDPQTLARRVGWSMTLKDLAPRLRCSQCGKKGADVVVDPLGHYFAKLCIRAVPRAF